MDMNEYLDSDSLRRQANTILRLTVVTIMAMIGTIATGFLGMNLIASADDPLVSRAVFFVVVLGLTRRAHAAHGREVQAPCGFPRRAVGRTHRLARQVGRVPADLALGVASPRCACTLALAQREPSGREIVSRIDSCELPMPYVLSRRKRDAVYHDDRDGEQKRESDQDVGHTISLAIKTHGQFMASRVRLTL